MKRALKILLNMGKVIIHELIVIISGDHKHKKKKKGSVELIFTDTENLKTKIKGGSMTKEISSKQRHEYDVVFKNKNGNPAFVDGNVALQFVDKNTGEPVATTATATATPVDPVDGNSSRHHIVVETDASEITIVSLAGLQVKVDIDVINDHDDSTSDDVKEETFDLVDYVFKPLSASGIGIENDTPVVDVP